MVKSRITGYQCSECGAQSQRWLGRCPSCSSWETLIELVEENADRENLLETDAPVLLAKAVPLNSLKDAPAKRISTGIAELDRVVGDGLVEGSVVLVGGEPGIGKSTLSLQLAQGVESSGHRILYVSAEESLEQLQLRAMRLGTAGKNILGLSETRI